MEVDTQLRLRLCKKFKVHLKGRTQSNKPRGGLTPEARRDLWARAELIEN